MQKWLINNRYHPNRKSETTCERIKYKRYEEIKNPNKRINMERRKKVTQLQRRVLKYGE